MLIISSTVQARPVAQLIKNDQLERVKTFSPMLFSNAPVPALEQ